MITAAQDSTAVLQNAADVSHSETREITSLAELAEAAAMDRQNIRLAPGTYRMADYLTEPVLEKLKEQYPEGRRPPRWMIGFSGNGNSFDLSGVELEIDTALYAKIPEGYKRCLFVSGSGNRLSGLVIRTVGKEDQGGANMISVFGDDNTLDGISAYISGSRPFGYGDLLGKGGPNLTGLSKHGGIMVAGRNNTLRRCRVINRAFGHSFYIQKPEGMVTDNIVLEDCYAEGVMRSTSEMLRDETGPAAELNYRSVYENRDGRFMITPGYMKALTEDGFRTYGGTGRVTLRNCIAVNTRAGFEIAGPDEGQEKTVLEGCIALGCERGFLIGGNTVMRSCRGDMKHGPLLYLRGASGSDLELELVGDGPEAMVHALATIAGSDHRVRLYTWERRPIAALPIMLGYGMPAHAEMSSPILPAETSRITLINEIPRIPVICDPDATELDVKSKGPVVDDTQTRSVGNDAHGAWPAGGIAR